MANVLSLVSYQIFPSKTGGQKGIALFNKYLSAFHTLTCVTVKKNDPSFADYKILNVLSNNKLRYINIYYFFLLKRIIKRNRIAAIIIEHPYYGWLGILLKTYTKIKLIVHSHNIEAYRFKTIGKWWWRILWLYEKHIHQQADHSFCISEEDRKYMISRFKIEPGKCTVVTYGIEWDRPPAPEERAACKKTLQHKHGISENASLYLFNGTLDYQPNFAALKIILNEINPSLQSLNFDYKIIICGKNLPAEMNELKAYENNNIIYAGFVDDVSIYFKGVDIFINPITDGGGIKTKLVEALGYNLTAVSSCSGAFGVDAEICNGKLLLIKDHDWEAFAREMYKAKTISSSITQKYFDHFYWTNIAKKAAQIIDNR